jgi:hypothetical protein
MPAVVAVADDVYAKSASPEGQAFASLVAALETWAATFPSASAATQSAMSCPIGSVPYAAALRHFLWRPSWDLASFATESFDDVMHLICDLVCICARATPEADSMQNTETATASRLVIEFMVLPSRGGKGRRFPARSRCHYSLVTPKRGLPQRFWASKVSRWHSRPTGEGRPGERGELDRTDGQGARCRGGYQAPEESGIRPRPGNRKPVRAA